MPDAIIFDMDGVIVDSERAWFRMEFERLSGLIRGWGREDHARLIGLSVNDAYTLLTRDYGLSMGFEEYTEFYRSAAREVYLHHTRLLSGVDEILNALKEREIPVGVASSSPGYWVNMVLERFNLRPYFRCVVSADDVGGKGKPSPEIYLEAARRMGIPPDRCVAIEDSRNGLLSAVRAGLYAIGFRNGHNTEEDLTGAHLEIAGFTEENRAKILALLKHQERR